MPRPRGPACLHNVETVPRCVDLNLWCEFGEGLREQEDYRVARTDGNDHRSRRSIFRRNSSTRSGFTRPPGLVLPAHRSKSRHPSLPIERLLRLGGTGALACTPSSWQRPFWRDTASPSGRSLLPASLAPDPWPAPLWWTPLTYSVRCCYCQLSSGHRQLALHIMEGQIPRTSASALTPASASVQARRYVSTRHLFRLRPVIY